MIHSDSQFSCIKPLIKAVFLYGTAITVVLHTNHSVRFTFFPPGEASDICVNQKYCFLKKKDHLEKLVMCGIILKWVIKKRSGTMSTGFVGLGIGARGGALIKAFPEIPDNS